MGNLQVQANLKNCCLIGASLGGACLTLAELEGANLKGADLQTANLRGARYNAATVFPKDFSPEAAGMIFTAEVPATGEVIEKPTEMPRKLTAL